MNIGNHYSRYMFILLNNNFLSKPNKLIFKKKNIDLLQVSSRCQTLLQKVHIKTGLHNPQLNLNVN